MAINIQNSLTQDTEVITIASNIPWVFKERIGDKVFETSQRVAASAIARVQKHPSGLWRKAGGGNYRVLRKDVLRTSIHTPGGEVGRAEAISEFAAESTTARGARMVSALDRVYNKPGGHGGGRILWAAYDDGEGGYIRDIQETVDECAKEIQAKL